MTVWRCIASYRVVHGPGFMLIALVVGFQLLFGVWQMVKYIIENGYRAAFVEGVVLAKMCAGALYSTMYLLLLIMSRSLNLYIVVVSKRGVGGKGRKTVAPYSPCHFGTIDLTPIGIASYLFL